MSLRNLYGGVSGLPFLETESSMTGCNISENFLARWMILTQFLVARNLRLCCKAQYSIEGWRETVIMVQKMFCMIGLTFGAHVVPGSVPMYVLSRAAS